MLVVLRLLWINPNPALLTGIIVACFMLVINFGGSEPKLWHHTYLTFVAQFPPVLACLSILVVSHRGGLGMAHKAWRYSIVSLLFYFLFVTRFFPSAATGDTLALHYTEQIRSELRLWHSAIIQLVFVGGLGQAMWYVLGPKTRSVALVAGVFIGSFTHSVVGFYGALPDEVWMAAMLGSFGPVAMITILVVIPTLVACARHPASLEDRLTMVAQATAEMTASVEWKNYNGSTKKRNNRRGLSSSRRQQDSGG